jgi:glucose-6-phosphate-specific signal transduction histidine kinase
VTRHAHDDGQLAASSVDYDYVVHHEDDEPGLLVVTDVPQEHPLWAAFLWFVVILVGPALLGAGLGVAIQRDLFRPLLASLKLQAATDQHAAMTEELDALTQSDPRKFSADQIWVLIRAIKVQSQILQMYVGEPQLKV